jgi:hypothetical protein
MKYGPSSILARRTAAALAFTSLVLAFSGSDATAADTCRDWRVDRHPRLMADINNDGKADIVGFGDAGVWTALANGDGTFAPAKLVLANFGANQGWDPSKHVRVLADINHDGMADIVAFGNDGVWTALAKGDGSFLPEKFVLANFGANQGWDPSKHVRALADINHDGRADIVAFGNDGVWTALAKGDGGFLPEKFVLANFGLNQGWDPSKHVRLLADINHGGMADIVAFGNDGVWTALAKGDGGFAPEKLVLANFGLNQGWDPSKHVRVLADVNHDGLADIVGFGNDGVWTALAKGDGGFAPEKFVLANFGVNQSWDPSKHVRLMADISKDAMADIVGFGNAGVWTALAKGDGGFAPEKFVLAEIFGCTGMLDFNLEWGAVDLGGFPINPRWRWQRDNPGVPNASLCHFFSKTVMVMGPNGTTVPVKVPDFADCTDQSGPGQVDTPDGWNGFICSLESSDGFHGHLNWFTATFMGGLSWGDHNIVTSTFTGGLSWGDHNIDDDYYMSLKTEGAPALVSGRDVMHTEFDSDETIDHFGSAWWKGFHSAVDGSETAATELNFCATSTTIPCTQAIRDALKLAIDRPRALFRRSDGSRVEAIMTGLFGVDCEHDGCKSELHPVYTMAAHVQEDPADDVWAIFLRNTGDEGYCSRKIWKAEFTSYTFRLPWRSGMDSVRALWGTNQSEFWGTTGTAGPAIAVKPGEGVDVTFTLPPPSQRPHIDGALHLQWRGQPGAPARPVPALAESLLEKHDEAGNIREAIERLPPAKRRLVEKARPAAATVTLHRLPAGAPARLVTALAAPPSAVSRLGTPGDVAARKSARDTARLSALCKAWNGSPPGLPPDLCAKVH